MKFLVDAQLPPALARWLQEAGHDTAHVEDVGLRDADDNTIWKYALDGGWAIVTKDEDFAAHSAQTAISPLIIWLRAGNTTNRAMLAWIEPRMSGIVQLAGQGHRIVEVI